MNIAAWLLSMVAPLVVRAVISLGFTVLTFTGVTELVAQLVSTAQANWAAMPAAVLQLVALSGVPQVLGMLFGALGVRVSMWVTMNATRYVFKK